MTMAGTPEKATACPGAETWPAIANSIQRDCNQLPRMSGRLTTKPAIQFQPPAQHLTVYAFGANPTKNRRCHRAKQNSSQFSFLMKLCMLLHVVSIRRN